MNTQFRIVNKNFSDVFLPKDNNVNHLFWNELKKTQSIDPLEWLFDKNDLDINFSFHTLKDVISNKNKIFHFIYYSSNLNFKKLFKNKDSKDLIDFVTLFKQKNVRILFIDPHECVNEKSIEELSKFLDYHKINKKNFLYINNDFYINEISKKYKINGIKWNHLFINTSSGYIKDSKNLKFLINRDFTFLCKNKMMKPHRIILLLYLKHNNLLETTNFSALNYYGLHYEDIQEYITNIFSKNLYDSLSKNINYFTKSQLGGFPIFETKYEKGEYSTDNEENINYAGYYNFKDYQNAYINITTETGFNEKFLQISEKSLKPFAMYQLPILVSCPFHIKAMKELYDLDFFDDFIDHSYDNEKDNTKRMIMIQEEILRLSKLQKELPKFFEKNKERFISNRKKIQEIGNWKETKLLNYILNF
tara:strand:+ start:712 stop:1968 length:1257 start_codon:yes stop_codon:yes gene_type:complete